VRRWPRRPMHIDPEGKPKIALRNAWGNAPYVDALDDHLLAHIRHFPIAGYGLGDITNSAADSIHRGGQHLDFLNTLAHCWDADRSGSPWLSDEALAIKGVTKEQVVNRVELKRFYTENLRKEREARAIEAGAWEMSTERARQLAEVEREQRASHDEEDEEE
jgi:hypothetical protein